MRVENRSEKIVTPAVELNRILEFRADGHYVRDPEMRTLGRAAPVHPGDTKDVEITFTVPSTMPCTSGRYIRCSYVLDVLTEISWAPDIELHFPVNIFIQPVNWQSQVGDVAGYAVSSPCVVEAVPFANGTLIQMPTAAAVPTAAQPQLATAQAVPIVVPRESHAIA
eukprot:SAG31_NODE_3813_length_3859_cov_5.983245_3_plen_167_part_00